MKYILLSLIIVSVASACIRAVPQVHKLATVKKHSFCLRGSATYKGRVEPVELCTESWGACQKALDLAKMYGRFANLNKVDRCIPRN